MIRIRVNMSSPRNNKEWLCLFGLHVRTATIILGVWHLCMNILALGALTVIVRNPSMVHELQYGSPRSDGMDQEMAPALPTPLSKIEPPGSYRDHDLNYQHLDMSGLIYLCLMSISGMLVYGALKGKRSYLLPFFCIQLFDFAVTTLTAANFLAYLRQVHRLLENRSLPWREEIMQLSPQTLSIVVLVAFITVVMLKAYTIGIVWRCYKFLTLQRQNLVASMLPYLIPDVNNPGGLPTGRMERDYSSLLPDYDEAIAQSLKQAPPPSYQMAMSVNGHVVLNDSSAAEQTTTRATASTSSEHRETETEDEGHASTIAILTYSPPPYEGNSTSSSTTGNQPPPLGAAAGASSAQAPSSTAAPVS